MISSPPPPEVDTPTLHSAGNMIWLADRQLPYGGFIRVDTSRAVLVYLIFRLRLFPRTDVVVLAPSAQAIINQCDLEPQGQHSTASARRRSDHAVDLVHAADDVRTSWGSYDSLISRVVERGPQPRTASGSWTSVLPGPGSDPQVLGKIASSNGVLIVYYSNGKWMSCLPRYSGDREIHVHSIAEQFRGTAQAETFTNTVLPR